MARKIVLWTFLLGQMFAVSCAPRGFQEPIATIQDAPATTTYTPPEPYSRKIGNNKVIDGYSAVSDLKLNIDGKSAETSLKGTVMVKAVGAQSPVNVDFEVAGPIHHDSYMAVMKATNADKLAQVGIEAGAKLTCLDTSCSQSFIDIYIKYQGYIYHHQVEADGNVIPNSPVTESHGSSQDASTPDATKKPKPAESGNDSSREKQKKPKKKKQPAEDDDSQFEHEDDGGYQTGAYVGDPEEDIKLLFPDSAPPAPVKPNPPGEETPTKPGPKPEPNKEEPKKTEPNAPAPKKPGTPTQDPTKPKPDNEDGGGIVNKILKKLDQAVTLLRRGDTTYAFGRLENATNLFDYQQKNTKVGFSFVNPGRKTYFGTEDMLSTLLFIGQYNQEHMDSYINRVGDVSREHGGPLGTHSSHQMGIDADISYYFSDPSKQQGLTDAVVGSKLISSFEVEKQWALFKTLVGKGIVGRIFVDTKVKKEMCNIASRSGDIKPGDTDSVAFETLRALQPWSGHDNHFHLRLKCSQAQPRCRQQPPPPKTTGC